MPKVWVEREATLPNGEKRVISYQVILCGKCRQEGDERYSLGIFAGYYCDKCWDESGIRKEGPEGFDPLDAGESYDPEPGVGGLDEEW